MTPPTIETPPKSALPSNTINFVGLYTMFFRGQTNSLQTKNFRFHGSLKEAHERAERHCKVFGTRLHWVQPLISDLDKEEQFHLSLGKEDEQKVNG